MGEGNGSAGRADKQSRGVKSSKDSTDSKKYANTLENLRNEFEHVNYGNRGDLLILRKLGEASFKQMNEDMQDALKPYGIEQKPEAIRIRRSHVSVGYSLVDDEGYVIGDMTRTYGEEGGKKFVQHSLFKLDESFQGKDIGKRLLKESIGIMKGFGESPEAV